MAKNSQFWVKNAQKIKFENFRLKFFGHFLKDHKMSSYGKNQKKIRKRLEEMGQKEHFCQKRINFGQKRPKNENDKFRPEFFSLHFLKDQKISSYDKNQENFK